MKISMTGAKVCLEGDWTLTGVTRNLDSLALSLQQLESGLEKDLRIDCGRMKEADISGLQLLNVWLQCATFRGMKPTLINVPERLQHVMQVLIGQKIVDTYPGAPVMVS